MKKLIPLIAFFFCVSLNAQTYNMTNNSVSTCSGTFYDSGGAAGAYGNSQNFTMTFCPSTPGSAIKLDFTAFNLQNNADVMYIYDGNSVTAPQFGTYTGVETPGIVQATGDNTSGCITIRFVSDTGTTAPGWVAAVSCVTPCQVINAQFVSSTPAPQADGIIKICQGDSVTFNGAATFSNSGAGATYEWTFDNGLTGTGQTATTTYPSSGVYRVNLRVTDPANCVNNNMINQIVQVSTTPAMSTTASLDIICFDDSATLSGSASPTPWNYECTPPVSGTTFLPDGSGVSYTTSIIVDCFESGQVLTNMNQLQSICLNMEHSYTGDLQITITSPTGQTIILKPFNGSSGPGSGGGGLHLGHPWDPGSTADDLAAGPGQGLDYCFSMTGTTYLVNGPTTPSLNEPGTTILGGTYLPSQSFAGLIGSLLNGTWTINVTDNLASDNGYIFSWGLTFDPALIPGDLSFTPVIVDSGWMSDPTITSTTGDVITVEPTVEGMHCYTYWVTDNFGCTYTTQKCIEMLEELPIFPANDLTSCDLFDLEVNIPVILGSLDPNYYPIMFHHSEEDAENVFDEITNPTTYDGFEGEVIYYSVQDLFNTAGCIESGQFILHIACPAPVTPPDLFVCDVLPNDGFGTFDLTPQTAIAMGANDPADYTITYHTSQADADSGLNDINPIDAFTNTVANCQTIYIRMESVVDPTTYATTDFDVCVHAAPALPTPADVFACEVDDYTLPALPAGSTYHQNTATGPVIAPGTVITTTQTIVIVAESGTTPNCTSEGDFIVTIIPTPATPAPANVSSCVNYTLPVLPAGQTYHSTSGGAAGTIIAPNTVISSTQVIWVVASSTTTPVCTSEGSFTVTIIPNPPVPTPVDVAICNSYMLPTLPAGQNYHSAPGGAASTIIPANTVIFTTQDIYVVEATATTPVCTSEGSFTVTIIPTPITPDPADVTVCDCYTLPALPAGQTYHSAAGGASPIAAGTLICTSQEVWIQSESATTPNCTSEGSFIITINSTPAVPVVSDVTACDCHILAALPAGQTYHSASGGSAATLIPAGSSICATQQVWVFAQTATTPNCFSEGSFMVNINVTPAAPAPADVTVCDSYTLPVLPAGQTYHSASGGDPLNEIAANTIITTTQTICIFAQTGTTPNCTSEGCFTVTVNVTPAIPVVADVTQCDCYVLPALPAGQTYHSASGGTAATLIPAGSSICATQQVWVFAQTATTPNCFSEASFMVNINITPAAPAPADVTVCDSYTLPVLPAGQTYHSASGGDPLNEIAANTIITTTQTICIFAQTGTTPNCTSEGCFTVTVNVTPAVPVVSDVTACDCYVLPALPAGQTYHSASGGDAATLIPAGSSICATQQVWVFAQTATTPNCFSEASFMVNINVTPIADDPQDVVACDSYELPALAAGNYFEGPNGTGTQHFAGEIITQSINLCVYAQTGTTPNCFTENCFSISIFPTPVFTQPTSLAVCDENTDGIGCFNLAATVTEITGGDPTLTVTFHETLADSENGVNAVSMDYCTIDPGMQTLYVRIFNAAAPQCAAYAEFVLQVDPRPLPNPVIGDYELCDINNPGDGVEDFDLLSMDAEILNGQTGIVVTYYPSLLDAENGTGAIDATQPYSAGPDQQIWVTVSNPATGCFSIGSFHLIVNPLPAAVAPSAMNACSDGVTNTGVFNLTVNNIIASGGVPGMIVTYYASLADAQAGDPATTLTPVDAYVSAPATVYIRVEDSDTGCFSTTTVELTVSQGPVANAPTPLQECDPNNDCFTAFDLTQAYNDISGGPTPAGVTITFHETETDALNGENAVNLLYTNIDPCTQVLFVRVSFDFTGCANYTQLQLIVNPTPEANANAAALQVCDDNTDGIAAFNLTLANTDILNGMNAADFTVTYHTTQANAQAGTPFIAGVLNFISPSTIIWTRVENNVTGCFDVVELELIVNPLPVVVMPIPSYTLCDNDPSSVQQELFDLGSQVPLIVNGQTGLVVTFHETLADAQAGTGDLPYSYQNPAGQPATTLHIRVENITTGCFSLTTMDVRVEPLPVLVPPMANDPLLIACDPDMDCFAPFNLDALIPGMLQGATGITVTFYETLANAQSGALVNALSSPYTNIDPCNQTIYVRAQNDAAPGCWSVISIELKVNAAPDMPVLVDQVRCDSDSNNQDGVIANWDLTTQETAILAAQVGPATNYEINYFLTQAAAELGTAPIINPNSHSNSSSPFSQQIWVNIRDLSTGCYSIGSFNIIVNAPLPLLTPSPLSVCDDGPTSTVPQVVFDLTVKDAEITGGNLNYTVQYFVTQADQLAGTNAIADPTAYTNVQNAQTLYVAVTGPAPTNCRSFTTLTIRVIPLPVPLMDPVVIEVCDDNAPVGTEAFDLTVNEDYIANGDPNMTFEYYTSLANAQSQTNMINPATNYQGATGIIYIRVMRNVQADYQGNFCYVIVEQPIKVNSLPELVTTPVSLTQCETDADGTEVFDLSDANGLLLAAPQDVADFTFAYYATMANAQTGTDPLGNSYTNTTPYLQTIFVVVTNTVTKCQSIIGALDLEVLVGALATAPTTDFFSVCDDDTDGVFAIDLTQADAEILNGQDPAFFAVHYYATQADYDTNTQIGDYTAYPASTGVVFAAVENIATGCLSDVVQFNVLVEPLADFDITTPNDSETICVDFENGSLVSSLVLSTNITDPQNYTFEWFLGTDPVPVGTDATYEAVVHGVYSVVATSTSALGCVSPAVSFEVIRSSAPVAQSPAFTVSNAFDDNQSITVHVEGYGVYEYSLDGGPWQSSNVFENVGSGEHYVDVRDTNSDACGPDLHIPNITAIDYPVYFTPNGDGYHDTWNIWELAGDASAKIYIFDRYGKLLKQISPQGEGWNGTFSGKPLPSTDYWFTVFYSEGGTTKEFKAHFSLKR